MKRLLFVLFHPDLVLDFIQEAKDVWGASVALAKQVRVETTHGSKLYILAENLETQVVEARGAFKKLLGEP